MKVKVSEATGVILDYLVTKVQFIDGTSASLVRAELKPYSTSWEYGGPIVDMERIEFRQARTGMLASYQGGFTWFGETHLIAAMRCFVAIRLGELEVEVPDDLV